MINSIFNFKINTQPNFKTQDKKNNFLAASLNGSNLAPLKKDTISFGLNISKQAKTNNHINFGSNSSLNTALLQAWDTREVCQNVYNNALVAMDDLKKSLKESLSTLMATPQKPHGIIDTVETRVKPPESIREKSVSEFEAALTNDLNGIFDPRTERGIKKGCGDLIGARVVLRQTDLDKTAKIVDNLIELVKKGKLNITKIENYVCKDGAKECSYLRHQDLKRLLDIVNANKKPGEKPAELETKTKKSGYTAVHLDLNLSNPDYKVKNDGFSGELQIIGYDVSQLKEVEDFCYKLKLGKQIKNGNPAYAAFSDYFLRNMEKGKEKYPNLDKDFCEYTAKAYLHQRKKEPYHFSNKNRKNRDTSLPSINDCNMQEKIPPELDYNKLGRIKTQCDKLDYIIKN